MFTLEYTDNRARAGVFHTAHENLQTPFFMPVATKGATKDLLVEELEHCNIRCMIANAFILSLQPTAQRIARHKGLHEFMRWKHGLFTDSGGFQVLLDSFLMGKQEDGVRFKNPFTGQTHLFSPQESMRIQHLIGADVAMAFDDPVKYGVSHQEAVISLQRTQRWLTTCMNYHATNTLKTNPKQQLFGIAQGGFYEDLREASAEWLVEQPVDGFAIGGLAIGEPPEKMFHAIHIQTKVFNKVPHKLRYVMGLGSPHHIVDAVGLGADIFDSIFPTQNARRGSLFTKEGILRITNSAYKDDMQPIESDCTCYTCQHYTRSYVHHLLKQKERVGYRLATIHNIFFMQRILDECRQAIIEKRFASYQKTFHQRYKK